MRVKIGRTQRWGELDQVCAFVCSLAIELLEFLVMIGCTCALRGRGGGGGGETISCRITKKGSASSIMSFDMTAISGYVL